MSDEDTDPNLKLFSFERAIFDFRHKCLYGEQTMSDEDTDANLKLFSFERAIFDFRHKCLYGEQTVFPQIASPRLMRDCVANSKFN